jgi:hypothetical protein
MATFLVFGRTAYAEPLALVSTVEAAASPAIDDLGIGNEWLELVLVPADKAIWVLRDGDVEWTGTDTPLREGASG